MAIHGLAVHGHTGLAGAPHVNHILGAPELPGDGVFLPVVGNAGLNPQTLVVRVNTQDGLGDGQEGPAGGAENLHLPSAHRGTAGGFLL